MIRPSGQRASMTKSYTGLPSEIMEVEAALDDTALVSEVIPEFGDSTFASATGVKYSENYSDPNAGGL